MPRLPIATRDTVPADARAAFDEVVAKRGGGQPTISVGPMSVLIHSPELAKRADAFSGYLRFETPYLTSRIRELATLLAARHMDCQFVWNDHAAAARKAGLSDALVDNLRDRKPLPAVPDDEAAVIEYAAALFNKQPVSDALYNKAFQHFGRQGLIELTTLMGYYGMLAFNANTFQISLREPVTEKVLPV